MIYLLEPFPVVFDWIGCEALSVLVHHILILVGVLFFPLPSSVLVVFHYGLSMKDIVALTFIKGKKQN